MKEDNQFAVAALSFTELKVIKDACKLFGDQGSQRAKEIAEHIERAMENISV